MGAGGRGLSGMLRSFHRPDRRRAGHMRAFVWGCGGTETTLDVRTACHLACGRCSPLRCRKHVAGGRLDQASSSARAHVSGNRLTPVKCIGLEAFSPR